MSETLLFQLEWGFDMGWYGTVGQTRAALIKELSERDADGKIKLLKQCVKGNVVWSVWEHPETGRWIGCDLMERSPDGVWMYKPMDESMGPFYYSCPLSYLDMAPVVNEKWRYGVMQWHAARKYSKLASAATR